MIPADWEKRSSHCRADMMDTLRAFIAIEMPILVADAVSHVQQVFTKEGIHLRWVKPGNAHLTLQFLGDISADDVPVIRETMHQSVFRKKPFSLRISGVGAFPGLRQPKVIWFGIKGQLDLLNELHRDLSASLADSGFTLEKRPFKGHLTIGRVKGRLDSGEIGSVLSRITPIETDAFIADSVCLFKSDLTPRGAVYTPLVRTEMKG